MPLTYFQIFIAGYPVPEWWAPVVSLIETLEDTTDNRIFARTHLTSIETWLLRRGLHDHVAKVEDLDRAMNPFGDEKPLTFRELALKLDELTDAPDESAQDLCPPSTLARMLPDQRYGGTSLN